MVRALDLCCKAGGASMGLSRVGFEVVGVDIEPQPRYPFAFVQADALEVPLEGFDFVWASPPCQGYTKSRRVLEPSRWPRLVGPLRDRLRAARVPYVIENVPGAPLLEPVMLCGSMFGLGVRRHRLFEVSYPVGMVPPCDHRLPSVGVYGHSHGARGSGPRMTLADTHASRCAAMGINWMTNAELAEAIPPAFSAFLAARFTESR